MSDLLTMRETLENSKFYTTEWQLQMLASASIWFIDSWSVSFIRQKPPHVINLLIILCQDSATNVIVPCFFGIFPHQSSLPIAEIYYRFFSVLQMKSLQKLEPLKIVIDYDTSLRSAVAQAFPHTEIYGSFIHKTRLLYNECKNIKCGLLGIKTAALSKTINYFIAYVLVISLMNEQDFHHHWNILKHQVNDEAFAGVISMIERDFVNPNGRYHSEMTFSHILEEKAFRIATPAIEGYHYRLKQLMKTYNVSSVDMLVEKVLVSEEKHFSSKVAEVNLQRIISPDLPEKFFFERSMGPLPIATSLGDIYGMLDHTPPQKLAELLIEQSEDIQLPQRRALVSLCNLEEYKKSLISFDTVSQSIMNLHQERKKKYREERKTRVKVEEPAMEVEEEEGEEEEEEEDEEDSEDMQE
ncbi:unnamed protein product [Blepharisma stoltei]|uniref:MULE transposase domain-containing protein n=1 Tax=Blepharisma stoltei TaxID=1481888 RepID=A0AAU9JLE0_9CILI|nr:unnamed protein product [Blepharisma stoltei]